MSAIVLPAHGWQPRWYQRKAWDYMMDGGTDEKHAELIWHRRAGKDEICLHLAATEMATKPATYWHMLPQANQVRKAIWEAINPKTGRRRIHDAFPPELFDHRENDMLVKSKFNASTWQCLGSDNYDSAVGAPPRGITYSEWSLANPAVRGYLSPIIAENRGWQFFIGTPRGKNHAYNTYQGAVKAAHKFGQMLSVADTGVMSAQKLLQELDDYIETYGMDYGKALFKQEYFCDFSAAIMGAIFGAEMVRVEQEQRLGLVEHDPRYHVHIGCDLGRSDDTSIWWFQVVDGRIHVLEHMSASGKDVDWFCSQLKGRDVYIEFTKSGLKVLEGDTIQEIAHRQDYKYGTIGLPHDGAAATFAAKGKTVEEQVAKVFGWGKVRVNPRMTKEDQFQAGRKAINAAHFSVECENDNGLDGLREYARQWDPDKQIFSHNPVHNWASHRADAWMQVGVMWKHESLQEEPESNIIVPYKPTFDDMLKRNRKKRLLAAN